MAGLAAIGLDLIEYTIEGSLHIAVYARLIFPHTDPESLESEYCADPRPTLMLVDSDEAELRALTILRAGDDICRLSTAPVLVVLRLKRVIDDLLSLIDAWRKTLPAGLIAPAMTIDLDHFLPINERFGMDGGN